MAEKKVTPGKKSETLQSDYRKRQRESLIPSPLPKISNLLQSYNNFYEDSYANSNVCNKIEDDDKINKYWAPILILLELSGINMLIEDNRLARFTKQNNVDLIKQGRVPLVSNGKPYFIEQIRPTNGPYASIHVGFKVTKKNGTLGEPIDLNNELNWETESLITYLKKEIVDVILGDEYDDEAYADKSTTRTF